MKQTFQIATSSPIEFTRILIDMAREGWDMDGESVEHAPQLIGNMWAVTLVRENPVQAVTEQQAIADEQTEEQKPTTQRRNTRKQA